MSEIILSFALGLVAALLVYPSGNRLDSAFPDRGWSRKVRISSRFQSFLIFKKKDQREKHLLLALIFAGFAYLSILTSVVFFVIALITRGSDAIFLSAIASFFCMAIAAVAYIIEMLVFLIAEIKQDKQKGEQK